MTQHTASPLMHGTGGGASSILQQFEMREKVQQLKVMGT